MTDSHRFLRRVWDAQPDTDYAFLAHKDWENGTWKDLPLQLPIPADPGLDEHDLYFAPVLFKERRRLKQHACGGVWLFADLDEVDPRSLGYLPPQVAWETSPGRYQAMWRLAEPLGPKAWERLNRAITYRTGADKGGWSLTKVLRLPGTVSTKHGFDFTVKVVQEDWEGTTDPDRIRTVCKGALPASDPATGRIHLPKASAREIRRTHWAELSPRARKLIRAKTVHAGDDRSARLWELENLCLDAGMTPGETVKVVKETVWNKYKGQRREARMLEQEALRAEAKQRARGQVPERRRGEFSVPEDDGEHPQERDRFVGEGQVLPNVMVAERFISEDWETPGWLVEGIWSRGGFGFWAGEYKAYKTWTVLDFAVSVASGTPFLGKYRVVEPGPVMYVHDEGRQGEVARQLWRVKASRGVTAEIEGTGLTGAVRLKDKMPLYVCSFPHLDLTVEEHRASVINSIRKYELKVLILEAWYLMSGDANENHANETTPMVKWLMQVSVNEGCSIIVSHHYNKGAGTGVRAGARMSGSGVFSRVFESAVYLERKGEEEDHTVKLTAQHRGHEGLHAMLKFTVDRDSDDDYSVHFLTEEEMARLTEVEMDGGGGFREGAGRPKKSLGVLRELGEGEAITLAEAVELTGASPTTVRRRLEEGGPGVEARLVKREGIVYVVGLGGNGGSFHRN